MMPYLATFFGKVVHPAVQKHLLYFPPVNCSEGVGCTDELNMINGLDVGPKN
jgi:hypothetical protein